MPVPFLPPHRLRTASVGAFAATVLLATSLAGTPRDPSAAPSNSTVHAQADLQWALTETRLPGFDTGGLYNPAGIAAAPGGGFFVADSGHHRIAVIGTDGRVERAFGRLGNGPAELDQPRDVAVNASRDRVYVADRSNRRLAVFTMAGDPVGEWMAATDGQAFVPHAVAVAPNGDVYVLSDGSRRVERFTWDGTWQSGFGGAGNAPEQLAGPNDLAITADGRVLVADTAGMPGSDRTAPLGRLSVFTSAGALIDRVAVKGIRDVAVHPDTGDIYVLHNSPSGDRDQITILNTDLTQISVINSDTLPDTARFAPAERLALNVGGRLGLTSGPTGDPARPEQGVRQYVTGRDLPVLTATTMLDPLAAPVLYDPVAIDAAADGTLLVAERDMGIVRRYRPDGGFDRAYPSLGADEIAATPDGGIVLGVSGGAYAAYIDGVTGRESWRWTCDCLNGFGLAASSDRLYATSALSGTVRVHDPTAAKPDGSFGIALPGYAWPLDVDLGPDGRLYAAGGEQGSVTVLDRATGLSVGGWPTGGGGPQRISVGPDGTVFTLRFDGTVAAWAPDGQAIATWSIEPVGGGRFSLPSDIAAAPNGRLYVLDGESHAILVYEPRPGTAPTPTATPDAPCTVTGNKTAAPAQVVLGQPVTIDLTVDFQCRGGQAPESEIMLIIDRSNSMAGVKLAAAKAAADSFVASPSLDFTANRVGLVSFSDLISLDQPLTHDRAAVRTAVGDIQHTGNTDLATALRRATEHVLREGRPGARPVLLMMTDGKPSRLGQPYVDTITEAARAKARGALVYTIGLGDSIETDLLVAVAGAPSRYFAAPRPDQLATIYDELSKTVGGVVATDVLVVDGLGADMTYVPGSATRGGTIAGNDVTWSLGALPSGKATLSLKVTPGRLGRLPTNTRANASYTAAGQHFTFEFPVPEVEVVAAPTATPTRTPRPTPRVTGPSKVYLPIVQRNHCQPDDARLGAEIVLVIDTSSSMAGAPLEAAKAAARQFVDLLDHRRDRAALVTFDATPMLAQSLTYSSILVKSAIDGMTTAPGTRADLGLAKGAEELRLRARTGSQRVLVFMSDGQPTEGTRDTALGTAADVRRTGAIIFAIGLGEADGTFLASIATSSRHYYHAPDPTDLEQIYRRVAGELPCR
ncbi:MAG: VWA domain-containing protein [Ardenticatenales bacterium]